MTHPSTGKVFEDALCDALEAWVDDGGVVMTRRQSFSERRGEVELSQETDIVVDSGNDDFYLGIEAKSRDTESSSSNLGIYLSQLNVEQFADQQEYAEQSGRDVVVAIEARNHCPHGDCAFIVPLALFTRSAAIERTKITWEEIGQIGAYIGSDHDYEIDREHIDLALAVGDVFENAFADPPDDAETIDAAWFDAITTAADLGGGGTDFSATIRH